MRENQQESVTIKAIVVMLALCVVLTTMTTVSAASPSIQSETLEVLGKRVNVVTVDTNNPNIRFDVAKGNDQLAGWEEFQSILDRTKPAAAINGNFFNAYAETQSAMIPWGYIIQNGEKINRGSNEGSFAVTFDREIIVDRGKAFSKDKIETMVQAGPFLVENGEAVFDPESSQFQQDRININPAQRSAIGIRPDGQVVMVTGSGLRTVELADIMQALGCHAATNLDGGASSALYANGSIITPPGRNLNTVLLVYDDGIMNESASNKPIQVLIDDELLEMEVPPAVLNGRTMVPLRAIFEKFNVDPEWNEETRTVTASTEDAEIVLTIGQNTASVNGETISLDAPGIIQEGRTLVPVRFIAESLGAEVDWVSNTRTVIIETETIETETIETE